MLTMQSPIEMQRPPVVRFGAGQVETLAAWLAATGVRRPFVVADRVNAARLDILGLKGATLFGEVKPEPDLPNLEEAVRAARAAEADAVIGFGGGSAMDLAKLVHQGIDEVGACVAQEFSAHAQTCVAIAVCEAPGAERDHDRQDLDASFGQ